MNATLPKQDSTPKSSRPPLYKGLSQAKKSDQKEQLSVKKSPGDENTPMNITDLSQIGAEPHFEYEVIETQFYYFNGKKKKRTKKKKRRVGGGAPSSKQSEYEMMSEFKDQSMMESFRQESGVMGSFVGEKPGDQVRCEDQPQKKESKKEIRQSRFQTGLDDDSSCLRLRESE